MSFRTLLAAIGSGLILFRTAGAVAASALPVSGSPFPEVPATAVATAGPFAVRGFHAHVMPERQSLASWHRRLELLKRLDYNFVFFGMGSKGASTIAMHPDGSITPNGCATADLRELVAHAVRLGLEPVFELKFIGKQLPLLREVIAEHPRLVIRPQNPDTVLNALYRLPDGRDAYSATALRLIEYLLALYPANHPARYFHLGIDEFSADDMATLAASMKLTPPECFAHCLNLGTDFVLKQGVTPIIWGDTLLSPALGKAEHGITLAGFKPDPRHQEEPGAAYHAGYKSKQVLLHTMVNHLRDRQKIIVADWHYSPSSIGEFPSVDYFQQLGFRDVWGCPWFNETNLRQFTRYAASRHCGGMVATAWNRAFLPEDHPEYRQILWSSAAFFRKPATIPPAAAETAYRIIGAKGQSQAGEKRTGVAVRGDLTLTFTAPVEETLTPRDARLLLLPAGRGAEPLSFPLAFDPAARELRSTFALPDHLRAGEVLELAFGYADTASGCFISKSGRQGLVLVDRPPQLPGTKPGALLVGEFQNLPDPRLNSPLWLGGECAVPLGVAPGRKPAGAPRSEALDVQWFDRIWALPSDYLNQAVARGLRLEVEAKWTGEIQGDPFAALLTKGSFSTGFRLLLNKDGYVLFQLANLDKGQPLNVTSKSVLPRNEWVRIEVTYRPPAGQQAGEATLRFDGHDQARKPVPVAMRPSNAAIGLGCEFGDPTAALTGKRRPNFPGLIRRVALHE